MKKLVMVLGMASLFASGMVMADGDDELIADDPTVGTIESVTTSGKVGGNLTVEGTVKANTCHIKADDVNKIVQLEEIFSNSLHTAGKTANPKDFSITLENCPIKSYNGLDNIKLIFDKTSPAIDPDTGNLRDTSGFANTAKNVQFQVLHDKAVVKFNDAELKKALASKNENHEVIYNFTAQYYATGAAEPGILSATIPFRIDYE